TSRSAGGRSGGTRRRASSQRTGGWTGIASPSLRTSTRRNSRGATRVVAAEANRRMSLVMPSPARAAGNPAHVRFAPLEAADLPLLHTWLNAPHVVAGYSRVHTTPEDVAAKYGPRIAGTDRVRGFIASVAGRPLGYVQTYAVADFPDYAASVGEF